MSQRLNVRAFGWIQSSSTVQTGGTGTTVDGADYLHGFAGLAGVGSSVGRPVAVTNVPSTTFGLLPAAETLMAYQKPSATIYSDIAGTICYRRSSNGGFTYGGETCLSETSTHYGLTAAYDPYSQTFLLAYTRTLSPTFVNVNYVAVIPATGSSVPQHVTQIGNQGWHPPAIACTGAATGCLAVFENADGAGSLSGFFMGVNLSSGATFVASSLSWGTPIYDTPALSYNPADSTFRMAFTDSNAAIFSFSMPAGGPYAWTGTGDIFNNSSAFITTAVYSSRYVSPTEPARPYGWFVRYF